MPADHLIPLLAGEDPAAIAWIVGAARIVVASGGSVSLERAAKLAATERQRARAMRDAHIARAACALAGGTRLATPLQLWRAFSDFRRACWPIWQAMREPPPGASLAEASMFWSLKSGVVPVTPQGLGRILRTFGETLGVRAVSETN
jgi:hypothetical protein